VARSVRLPVIVYNIPGRSVVDLAPETLARICDEAPNVVGVKEATGNVLRTQKLSQTFGDRLTVLSGDDVLTLPLVAVGARGVISVTSNVLPAEVSRATLLAIEGRFDEARRAHFALVPVHEAMFLDASPGPAKFALSLGGLAKATVRSPLCVPPEHVRTAIAAALDGYTRAG
jgi:4-hydroxy-tetrahydrodipicolinate synthase